jgi:Pilus formation protein N terminal region
MQALGKGHNRDATRLRLLQLMVPSLAMGSAIFSGVVNAQLTMQVPPQPTQSSVAAPVLKSVGINFRMADSASPKASKSMPEPTRPVDTELASPNKRVKPDILLPPLVAGAIATPANSESAKRDSVKIDVHLQESTQAKSRSTMMVVANNAERLPPTLDKMVVPPVLPDQLQGNSSQSLTLQVPLSTPSPILAENKSPLPTDSQRSAQVVRLPSMKVSHSKIVETPRPASENSAPTPKSVPSLVLNKPSAPPEARPVTPVAPQTPNGDSYVSNEDSFRVRMKDEEQLPTKTASESRFAMEQVTQQTDKASNRPDKDFKALPPVVALPVSRVQSFPSLVEADEKDNARSQVATRKTTSTPSPVSMSKQSLPKTIEVLYRSVQTIDVGRPIARIDIQDDSVCKALTTEGTNVILIGLAHGQTTVNIWPATVAGEEVTPESYKVSVANAWKSETQDNRSPSSVEDVQQTLSEIFPSANIIIKSASNGSLIIFGKAESNEQAKTIAQLVRKTFLVPVVDRIAVTSP